jgi:hypothetical protein
MKMKRYLSLLLCAALLCCLLAGCGGANTADRYYAENESYKGVYDMMGEVAPMETMPASDGSLTSESPSASNTGGYDRKLIKTVYLTAESQNYNELLTALDAKIAELGGYVENMEMNNSGRRYCSMIIRIPVQWLDQFVDHVEESANVTNATESALDVTLEYVDTEAKVKALETEQARLLELLAKAESLDDILAIEARLSDVTYELERYASHLKGLENRVSYATVHLSLREVEVLTPKEDPTVGQRISTGFVDSVTDLWDDIVDLFVFICVESPNILVFALLLFCLFRLAFALEKRYKKKHAAPQEEKKPE